MKNKFFSLLAIMLAFAIMPASAQDLARYKDVVKTLSSKKYQGRGYARGGANKAGRYLYRQLQKAGMDELTTQPFKIDINTFPGRAAMSVDGKSLIAGREFSPREYSPGTKGEFPLYFVDTLNYDSKRIFADLEKPENKNAMVVCDFWFTYKHSKDFRQLQTAGGAPNAGLLLTWETPLKFFKAYGEKVVDKPVIWVGPECVEGKKRVKIDLENKMLKGYECFNVIGKVAGERHDSCFVFIAHYDHVGSLGRHVFYPGANDNASGTATLVTLAEYYAKHKPKYDMYFIAFSGEDANLRGSNFFTEHPITPLEKIKYLINIDMIGDNNPVLYCETSDAGLSEFAAFERINNAKRYFKGIERGALAANSDHYPFAKKGVPCIYFENEKGDAFKNYHSPQDSWENAITVTYEPLFRLVRDFIEDKSSR